jgi:hypothetical protein
VGFDLVFLVEGQLFAEEKVLGNECCMRAKQRRYELKKPDTDTENSDYEVRDSRLLPWSAGHPPASPAVYTTNMATPAANIATVVIATTIHPKRGLG